MTAAASVTVRRKEMMGSSTEPSVFESGAIFCIAAGLVRLPFRPINLERSVSHEISPGVPPWPAIRCRSQGGFSSSERARRVQRMAEDPGRNSVCTNKLLKAGCASSAACVASVTSA